jgi:hypothetical protein
MTLLKIDQKELIGTQSEAKPIPIEHIVTEDVRKVAKEVAARKVEAVKQSFDANITINVGVALQLYHSAEDLDWYTEKLQFFAEREYKRQLKKAKKLGVFEKTKSGIILPN